MKRNNFLLESQLRNKFIGDLTTAYIAEAFVNGLPFDETEVANEHDNLVEFAGRVISTMHPEKLLANALENAKTPASKIYLRNLKTAVENCATESARKNLMDSSLLSYTTPEMLEVAKVDDKEVEKFASKNSVDAVADLVKDKMVETIKSEREQYEKAAKIRSDIKDTIKTQKEELKEELADEPDVDEDVTTPTSDENAEVPENDPTVESFCNIVLEPTAPRAPISVFSRMQDLCMEALFHSNEEYNEIPYKTITKIALEHTFPMFDLSNRNLIDAVESMTILSDEECDDPEKKQKKVKKIAKTAFISTITIMTMLEVLKTMGIASPTMQQVKDFVHKPTEVGEDPASPDKVEKDVDDATNQLNKAVAMGAVGASEAASIRANLSKVKAILENTKSMESNMEVKNRILSKIDDALLITESMESVKEHPFDSYSTKLKDENIVNIEYAVKSHARKPAVESINFIVDSEKETDNRVTQILVQGKDINGSVVTESSINFNNRKFLGNTLAEALTECATYAELDTNKHVGMYFSNACYGVELEHR